MQPDVSDRKWHEKLHLRAGKHPETGFSLLTSAAFFIGPTNPREIIHNVSKKNQHQKPNKKYRNN